MKLKRPIILIVDDEEAARYGMRRALDRQGYHVIEAADTQEARQRMEIERPDLLLLDLNLPGESGMEFLQSLPPAPAPPLVIVITAHGSERTAVQAIKRGAYDYLSKPFEVDELRLVVKNALEKIQLQRENQALREQLLMNQGFGRLIGASPAMRRVYDVIEKVAETDVTVLIQGESGTGKELVAREIHERSARRDGPFVAVNCAAMPSELIESELFGHEKGAFTGASQQRKGKFELAHRGTLLLDEIGDMSLTTQAKVLRAVESREIERLGGSGCIPVDVRIISATHKDLDAEIAAERFREDLYYRLRVVTIKLPPLRERREDIPLLAQTFCARSAAAYQSDCRQIAPDALTGLMEYSWPGNVRELRNVIERSVVLCDGEVLRADDLPEEIRQPPVKEKRHPEAAADDHITVNYSTDYHEVKRAFERHYLEMVLRRADHNITRAAEMLGLHRQSLQQKLRQLGISRHYKADESPP
jgi:DNA-binding NtrC family response regulator